MRLSERWLREWVDPALDADGLAAQLTMAGLEVDAVEPAAPAFTGVVVGRILDVAPHPGADRLQVCRVEAGLPQPLTIVCGAANARPGLCAPLALAGAALPNGVTIRQSAVRGIESAGMLCSARELGLLESAEGLLELPADAPVGRDLREYLELDDRILVLELTPNRGDCLSVQGIARELAALNGLALRAPAPTPVTPTLGQRREIRILEPARCLQYAGRVVSGINPQARTPQWMCERLRRGGIRSIHPVVDVTNYVLLELGQPMHAFDLARLQGGICVRRANPGESLMLLDGQTVQLHDSTLVIADDSGPVAMAGVMGGAATAVVDGTTSVFFESACFTPGAVAGQGRRYKLHTDSLHRFERGVDPELQVAALERATRLLLEIAGGAAGPVVRAGGEITARPLLLLSHSRLERLLGMPVPPAEVQAILARLGMQVAPKSAGEWQVTPPSYRYDIAIEADLIEEVARLHGYDRLPALRRRIELPAAEASESTLPGGRLREALVQRGYQEAVTYSFVDAALQARLTPDAAPLDLDNPIAQTLAQMRSTLWSSLLPVWARNVQRQQTRVRLFELGMRFVRDGSSAEVPGVSQSMMLAGLVAGPVLPEQWGAAARHSDFYDLKADVEALLALGAGRARFEAAVHPALHPGQSARVWLDGRAVGWLGRAHPGLAPLLEVKAELPLLFELELSALQSARVPAAGPLSEYPQIRRDLAIVVSEQVAVADIVSCIKAAEESLLQDVLIFDVYRGQGLQSGCKSIALGLIFQDYYRTLTDTEVDQSISRLQVRLQQELGASLRG